MKWYQKREKDPMLRLAGLIMMGQGLGLILVGIIKILGG